MQPGKIVRVKSGGPKMTIDIIEGEFAWCTWFVGDLPRTEKFLLTTLKEYSAPVPPSMGDDGGGWMSR